jgi:hypothetical protein
MGVLKAQPHLQLLALRAREQGLKHYYFDPPVLTFRLDACLEFAQSFFVFKVNNLSFFAKLSGFDKTT